MNANRFQIDGAAGNYFWTQLEGGDGDGVVECSGSHPTREAAAAELHACHPEATADNTADLTGGK